MAGMDVNKDLFGRGSISFCRRSRIYIYKLAAARSLKSRAWLKTYIIYHVVFQRYDDKNELYISNDGMYNRL